MSRSDLDVCRTYIRVHLSSCKCCMKVVCLVDFCEPEPYKSQSRVILLDINVFVTFQTSQNAICWDVSNMRSHVYI